MTILTKPFNEKKSDKSTLPFVATDDSHLPSAPIQSAHGDAESVDPLIIDRRRRMSSATTIFLFLSAIAVMCMGILGGVTIYRIYAPTQAERMRFHGFCGVPYDSQAISNAEMLQVNNDWRTEARNSILSAFGAENQDIFRNLHNAVQEEDVENDFFREEFELDLSDDESFAKITVPDFKDGRRGRFIHDFKQNQSGIIDNEAGRCFIMPLDRETVLPPKSLYDLLTKMWDGYYNIDTDRVRKNMRVVTPQLTDLSLISPRIAKECMNMNVYMLEQYVSGVFKRDVSLTDSGKFAGFSGKHIVEIDLVNIKQIEEMENRAKADV